MDWKDILFLLALICFAGIILYRTIRKKKWCPVIYGSKNEPNTNQDKA